MLLALTSVDAEALRPEADVNAWPCEAKVWLGLRRDASLTTPSWNQIYRWLKELDLLRQTNAA